MSKQACATVHTNNGAYSLKKVLVNSTMAACVATAGFAYINPVTVSAKSTTSKTTSSVSATKAKQMAKIIKKIPLTYTEPKSYAKTFVISDMYKEASYMKKDTKINQSYFSDKISDISLPKKAEEGEVFEFSTGFEYVEETPNKYNYSYDDVVKDYDTSRINENRETYEF